MREKMESENDKLDTQTNELVQKAQDGDPEAVSALYRLYASRLNRVVRRRLGYHLRTRMETEDLVQSVWKDVLSDMHGFEYRGPESFFRWLVVHLNRKIQDKGRYFAARKRDHHRERSLQQGDSQSSALPLPAAEGLSPSQVVAADEEAQRLERLLQFLSETQRRALILRLKEDLSFDEIGEIMGKTSEAARKLYCRGLKKLGTLMHKKRPGGNSPGEPRT